MSDAPTVAGEIDDLAAMSESVEERGGKDRVTEDFSPPLKALVRCNDDRGLFIEFRNEGEEEIGLGTGNREITELIDNKELAFFEPTEAVLRLHRNFLRFEYMHKVVHGRESGLDAQLPDSFVSDSEGEVRLSGSGRPDENEVVEGVEPFEP